MRLSKIFPAAAGVIALTATVSFARDQRDFDEDDFCRTRITNCNLATSSGEFLNKTLPISKDTEKVNAYVVEITHGVKTWLVSIDAYTGRVLESRNIKERVSFNNVPG